MITYDNALQIIRETALTRPLGKEDVPLTQAANRICAADLYADMDIQPFDNSAMDGFAVRREDLKNAALTIPLRLTKAGIIAAGQDSEGLRIAPMTCWHVMTGAMIPAGTDAIIPVEDVRIENDHVIFSAPPESGQHIRRAGEDFKKGTLLLPTGTTLTPAHILPLATLGIAHVTVFKKPKILFIPTGTEIIDDLNAPLANGHIYNSNRFHAQAFLNAIDADVTIHDIIRDDLSAFAGALARAQNEHYDIIVSSGAVSAGTFDFVKDGLEQSGAKILYHKMKLKPGKPNLLATLPSGALYFGLPGNPAATAVSLRFFVAEALRMIRGQKPEGPVYARALNSFTKKRGLHMVLKGRLTYGADGTLGVDFLDGQESFKVSPFLNMNGWIHVAEDQEEIKAGEIVATYPLLP